MNNLGNKTGSSNADNATVIDFTDVVDGSDSFMLMSTGGAMDVYVTLDGTNYSTAPLSLADLGGTSTDPVLVTVAGRLFGFRGMFKGIRVLQAGGVAVTAAVLRYGTM